jgi:D-alanyl-D-alanine carboxypeptidase (penicillin-binding protein 5/6)
MYKNVSESLLMRAVCLNLSYIIIVLYCVLLFPVHAEDTPDLALSAECAVLIDADSGEIFYKKNPDKIRPMASTTKIMTAIIALENEPLTKKVCVSREAIGVIGSSIYLYEGEQLSLEELLYAMMLESANDAAAAIAIEVADSVENFAVLMNKKAAELGLNDTNFTNPHGLYDERHYTTASNLAALTAYALKNEDFRTIVSTYKRVIPLNNNEGSRVLINHNKLLTRYKGTIGVKTGYTIKSGRCLVSAAVRDGLTLIAVTLNAPDDWNDHKKMLDYGFETYERIVLSPDTEEPYIVPVVGGNIGFIQCDTTDNVSVVLKKKDKNITSVIELKRFYYAPITEGTRLGQRIFYNNGEEIARVPVNALYNIESVKYKFSLFKFIADLFTKKP